MEEKRYKWTVFFLIKSTGVALSQTVAFINKIRKAELCSTTGVSLCITAQKGDLPAIESGKTENQQEDKSTTTAFYYVASDECNQGLNMLVKITEKEGFRLDDPVDVKTYFTEQVLKKMRADHYLLFTWDHGDTFGIFDRTGDTDPAPVNGSGNHEMNWGVQIHGMKIMNTDKFVRADLQNEQREFPQDQMKNVLSMDELASAVEWAFGRPIDVMVMMNCYMQQMDTCYALRKSIRYLVAPENAMDFNGYDYEGILNYITSFPDDTPYEVAEYVVRSFAYTKYERLSDGEKARDDIALFAWDLSFFTKLADLIDRIAERLSVAMQEDGTAIVSVRNSMTLNLTPYHTYDIITFLEGVDLVTSDEHLKSLIQQFIHIYKVAGVYYYIGKNWLGRSTKDMPRGLTVFFPILNPTSIQGLAFLDFYKHSTYSDECRWNHFVLEYFVEKRKTANA